MSIVGRASRDGNEEQGSANDVGEAAETGLDVLGANSTNEEEDAAKNPEPASQ